MLYASFSAAWVIYLTARIILTFVSISTFPKKKLSFHVSSIISIHVISPKVKIRFPIKALNFFRCLFNHLDNVHLTARIISIFITVSYCNVFLGFTVPRRSKVHFHVCLWHMRDLIYFVTCAS